MLVYHFRTLVPELPNKAPHIKLSTNVHITGEIRTLSEQTTHNGPLVTHILNDILTKDSTFKQYASTVIDEVAGIHFIILMIVMRYKQIVVNN